LEQALGDHYGVPTGSVSTVCNATAGITAALMAAGARSGTLCAMPAWTFIATPMAALGAGLTPWFVDVSGHSESMEPADLAACLSRAPGQVGAVIVVAPFGRPINWTGWADFSQSTGIPVVVDAAAAFDTVQPTALLSVVSLHATKIVGAGEGAFVVSTNDELVQKFKCTTAFGFRGTRECILPSMNAKLNEYSAAVALAAVEDWPTNRRQWMKIAQAYRDVIADSDQLTLQPGFGTEWLSSTVLVTALNPDVIRDLEHELTANAVEYRHWWGSGAHQHRVTRSFPHEPLNVTNQLASTTIGLPFYLDLPSDDVLRIARILRSAGVRHQQTAHRSRETQGILGE
jgi:dTDP-4-amino-4,6-dideoxygalactose transaminase